MTTMLEQPSTPAPASAPPPPPSIKRRRYRLGPQVLWLLVCVGLAVLVGLLRLWILHDRYVPLAHGLPLLVCLWNRDKRLLHGMGVVLTLMSALKAFWLLAGHGATLTDQWLAFTMPALSIWILAVVVHLWINSRGRLEAQALVLEEANAELQASNEELAARDEEITHQNEELQSQTEELEQQAEELTQQTEEMELSSRELQAANEELTRRQQAMGLLVEATRWLGQEAGEAEVFTQICRAARAALGPERAVAALIVEREGEQLTVIARDGTREALPGHPVAAPFALLVMAEGRTAYVRDVALRPDLQLPRGADGREFRSVLASPLRRGNHVLGALKVYSVEPRDWTEADFGLIEWVATQASLLLEATALQREIAQRRQEAEEASQRKTRFLAAVSHDVRTPVNAINLLAELIVRTAGEPSAAAAGETRRLAGELRDNAKSLIELVSDVLDIARFDSGKADLQVAEFSLSEMLEREVAQYRPLAQSVGLEMVLACPPEPVGVRTDRLKLARILDNLLGNAIKFTDAGSIRVELCRVGGGGLVVRVIDTGVGIAPEHLPHIFDEFRQLRNPERDRTKGAGLGLAICQRLTNALGCTLSVQSQLGAGTTFTIGLPSALVVAAKAPDARPAAPASALRLDGRRMLLVEDHDTTRRTMARLLRSEGAVVLEAATAREGILALRQDPEVVLLDLMLPDLDGREVLRAIRADRPARLRQVLVVSGDVSPARLEEVRSLGADDMLAKPIDLASLVVAVTANAAATTKG